MRPAYLPIAAAILAVISTALGIFDVIGDSDAGLLVGLAIVLAVLGLREQ